MRLPRADRATVVWVRHGDTGGTAPPEPAASAGAAVLAEARDDSATYVHRGVSPTMGGVGAAAALVLLVAPTTVGAAGRVAPDAAGTLAAVVLQASAARPAPGGYRRRMTTPRHDLDAVPTRDPKREPGVVERWPGASSAITWNAARVPTSL